MTPTKVFSNNLAIRAKNDDLIDITSDNLSLSEVTPRGNRGVNLDVGTQFSRGDIFRLIIQLNV